MKTLLVCILISALTIYVQAQRPISGGPITPFSGQYGGPRCGPNDGYGVAGQCYCNAGFRRNLCSGVPDSQIGCPNTNQYLQCTSQVCSLQTCASGQVWNKTLNACAACTAGMHVAANGKICVCDKTTTYDPTTKSCVPCPQDSTQLDDTCYCPSTKAIDYKNNACKDCPAGANLTRSQTCQCSSTQFWNDNDWACQDCPGEWLPKIVSSKRNLRQPPSKCVCAGTNQIFDRENVKCYTCPTGTTASSDNSSCLCPNRFQLFNTTSQKCECIKGFVADAAGTGCVRPALTTVAAPASP